jgi:hypothetical protein
MRIWIREASGVLHEGVNVQGSGGIVRGRWTAERMTLAVKRATAGQDTGLYEPKPGHVLGFYGKARGPVAPRQIDLRGATIERVADEPLPQRESTRNRCLPQT